MQSAGIRVVILIELEVSLDGKAKARKIFTLDLAIDRLRGLDMEVLFPFCYEREDLINVYLTLH